tara:strand:- start:139 stop:1107 length:969 start_codon:yes stop_codon:yes gene_type:complete
MPGASRAMALEAGAAAHESFAAVKWYQYWTRQAKDDNKKKMLAIEEGHRIFGEDRFYNMLNTISHSATDRTNIINFSLEALYTSGYYDDPSDRRRTISNLSEGIICYIDSYDLDKYKIYESPKNIGVEIAFDTTVTVEWSRMSDNKSYGSGNVLKPVNLITTEARFTGKMDGLLYNKDRLMIWEDKTGARIDDAWLSQWVLSHQITGYCLAATAFTGEECLLAQVSGMKVPIAKTPSDTIRKEMVNRSYDPFITQWANWFVHSVEIDKTYKDHIEDAPKYTHSCNRYFRPCSFVPYCVADTDEKKQILDEMEIDEWSPLAGE